MHDDDYGSAVELLEMHDDDCGSAVEPLSIL